MIKLIAAFTAILIFAPMALQQAPAPHPPPAAAPKPPQITDAQKAAYWKAYSDYQGAAFKEAQVLRDEQEKLGKLQALQQSLVETCGENFVLQGSASGDPECVQKQEVKK